MIQEGQNWPENRADCWTTLKGFKGIVTPNNPVRSQLSRLDLVLGQLPQLPVYPGGCFYRSASWWPDSEDYNMASRANSSEGWVSMTADVPCFSVQSRTNHDSLRES